MRAHVVTTAKLIEAVAVAAPGARLIRIGSAAEYGAVPYGLAVEEYHPATRERSATGSSTWPPPAWRSSRAGPPPRHSDSVLRIFNPVGPGMPPGNMLARVTAMVRSAVAGGVGDIALGLHDTYRDFVDVRDVAAAVLAATRCAGCADGSSTWAADGGGDAGRRPVAGDVAGFPGEIRPGTFPPDATRSAAVPGCAPTSTVPVGCSAGPRVRPDRLAARPVAGRRRATHPPGGRRGGG